MRNRRRDVRGFGGKCRRGDGATNDAGDRRARCVSCFNRIGTQIPREDIVEKLREIRREVISSVRVHYADIHERIPGMCNTLRGKSVEINVEWLTEDGSHSTENQVTHHAKRTAKDADGHGPIP